MDQENVMSAEPHLRVALYARVSTESQEEHGESLPAQIATLRADAAALGAVVVKTYPTQESAMPGHQRPSITRLLKDAANGEFDAVMICKMDRLARAYEVQAHVETKLK